jgi:predicted DsbA family dithiol-disulfide isomerase
LIVARGLDPAEIEKNILRPIEDAARREGLTIYRAIDRTLGPTDHAHELLAFASTKGLHAQAWRRMFRAHFGEARKFWTVDQCVEFAADLGLDATESRLVLEDRRFREQVEDDQHEARRLGATGTPFMLIDRRYPVPGARDTEELLSLLRRVWRDNPRI